MRGFVVYGWGKEQQKQKRNRGGKKVEPGLTRPPCMGEKRSAKPLTKKILSKKKERVLYMGGGWQTVRPGKES